MSSKAAIAMYQPIPTKAQWFERTEIKYKLRSGALRKVD